MHNINNTQVFSISSAPLATSCDDLYFQWGVLHWASYKVSSVEHPVECRYSQPPQVSGDVWDHTAEKLARATLMFADEKSYTNPSEGIRLGTKNQVRNNFTGLNYRYLLRIMSRLLRNFVNQSFILLRIHGPLIVDSIWPHQKPSNSTLVPAPVAKVFISGEYVFFLTNSPPPLNLV